MPSLEVYEQLYPRALPPVRVPPRRRRAPGAWRGGTGVEYEIDIHTEGTWSFRGEGAALPQRLRRGGGPGR